MCLGKSRSISYLLKRNIWFKMFIDQRLENLFVNRPTLVSGGKDHGRRRIGIWIRRSTAACVLSCSPCHTILPGCAPVSGGNSYSAADVAWPSPPPQCVPGIYSPDKRRIVLKLLRQDTVSQREWQDLFFGVHFVCLWDEKGASWRLMARKIDFTLNRT